MRRMMPVVLTFVLVVAILTCSFACNLLPEINKPATSGTNRENLQSEESKPMMATLNPRYTRVNISSNEEQANAPSHSPRISSDGRYVAFISNANNLTPDHYGGAFVRDIKSNRTFLASPIVIAGKAWECNTDDKQRVDISNDGRYVVFDSNCPNLIAEPYTNWRRIYVRDRVNNTYTRADFAWNWEPNHKQYLTDNSYHPRISADGRYVAYESNSYFIVQSDTNSYTDVFVYDAQNKVNIRVSNPQTAGNTDGHSRHPSISGDGRYVAFESIATNIVSNDTNDNWDIFVRDIISNKTSLVSIGPDGKQVRCGNQPSISSDGRYIAFVANQTYLMTPEELFIRDCQNNITRKITPSFGLSHKSASPANSACCLPDISGNGRYVVFLMSPQNTYDYDVILHDVINNTSIIIASGHAGNVNTFLTCAPSISSDGRYIAFVSDEDNLVAGDTNGQNDIFVCVNNTSAQLFETPTNLPIKLK